MMSIPQILKTRQRSELLAIVVALALAVSFPSQTADAATILSTDVLVVEDADGSITSSTIIPPHAYLSKVASALFARDPALDIYDVLFVFSTESLGGGLLPNNTPMGITVYQDQQGIGKSTTNLRGPFGTERLKHAVSMGWLQQLPDDPNARWGSQAQGIPLSAVQVMAHELGHYWLAYVAFDRNDGFGRQCLLRAFIPPENGGQTGNCSGYPDSAFTLHWSFYFNSESVMFGNQIEQVEDRLFRFVNDGGLKFGPLDQYLMGLRAPEEVGPLFFVHPEVMGNSIDYPLMPGTEREIRGSRRDVTVEDIIRVEGARVPATDPCHWKGALVVVFQRGKPPTQQQLQKVADYGTRFEEFYAQATDGRGSIDLTRDNRGRGTDACPADGLPPDPPDKPDPDPDPRPDVVSGDAFAADTPGPQPPNPEPGPDTDTAPAPPQNDTPHAETAPTPETRPPSDTARDGGGESSGSSGGCTAAGATPPAPWVIFLLLFTLKARHRPRRLRQSEPNEPTPNRKAKPASPNRPSPMSRRGA